LRVLPSAIVLGFSLTRRQFADLIDEYAADFAHFGGLNASATQPNRSHKIWGQTQDLKIFKVSGTDPKSDPPTKAWSLAVTEA
jgi:hypothetical protein